MKAGAVRSLVTVATMGLIVCATQARAETAWDKFKRGNANFWLSGLEIPNTIKEVNHEHGALAAATWGPLKGLGRGLTRKLIGVHEIVTWPVPVPKNYEPVIQPEYPWDHR